MENLIKQRIEENKKIFNEEELTFFYKNVNIIYKIYLLGLIDAKQIYGKN